MYDINTLNTVPENTVVTTGKALAPLLHLLTPPTLTTLVRDPEDPFHTWEVLSQEYPADHALTLLAADGTEASLTVGELKQAEASLFEGMAYLIVPPLPENRSLEYFENVVAILRGPHGCPWDKKQTHQSIRDDFLQEAYELIDALDRLDTEGIMEELGDVLLHIFLQAEIAQQSGEFDMSRVSAHAADKIIFRHEHVFGSPETIDSEEVLTRWEQMKQRERAKEGKKGGLLDGISKAMPALSMAYSYQKRAAKTGFDWEDEAGVWDKMAEELNEYRNAETAAEKEEELGDVLFTLVNLARWNKIDPETALRMANLKFRDRIRYVERRGDELGESLFDMTAEEKDALWEESKGQEQLRRPRG